MSTQPIDPAEETDSDWRPAFNPWFITVVVALAAFMEILDTSIANVALPHIAGSLGATNDESTWVLTSYLTSNAIVLPMSGWLANMFGRKRFFMLCLALFTASSVLCGLSTSLGMLIFFRILQGIGGGALQPLSQAILADTFPHRMRAMAFAVFGITAVVAPALGPTLGGWITDNFSWPWIFFINLPVGLLTLVLLARVLEDPPFLRRQQTAGVKVDYLGIAFLTLGVGALQVFLDKGQQNDWLASPFIVTLMAISVVCLTALAVWEWFQKDPVVEVRLLRNPNVLTANLMMFAAGIIMFSCIVLMPMFLQTLMGYDATTAGLVLSGAACQFFILMPFTAWLNGKVQGRIIVAAGWIAMAASMIVSTMQMNLQLSFSRATWLLMFQQAGIALVLIPVMVLAFIGIPPEKNNAVSSLLNFMRNIGSSVGTSMVATLLARRAQTYQVQLTAHTTIFDPRVQALLQGFSERLGGEKQALTALYRILQAQAAVLAYVDLYRILGALAIAMVISAVLLKKNKPGEEASVGIH
jgi:DHA2 family multidrug resistance protein